MTMHMAPAYLTTTRTNHKKKPSAKQAKATIEHQKWLKTQGLHIDQLAPKKKEKLKKDKVFNEIQKHHEKYPSGTGVGNCPKKEEMAYSGEQKLLGIAVLHKSCLQPVFSKDYAKEISKMRR